MFWKGVRLRITALFLTSQIFMQPLLHSNHLSYKGTIFISLQIRSNNWYLFLLCRFTMNLMTRGRKLMARMLPSAELNSFAHFRMTLFRENWNDIQVRYMFHLDLKSSLFSTIFELKHMFLTQVYLTFIENWLTIFLSSTSIDIPIIIPLSWFRCWNCLVSRRTDEHGCLLLHSTTSLHGNESTRKRHHGRY